MTYAVTVELSEETVARLGDLATATGRPPAELVRAAVESKYGRRPAVRHRPHRPVAARTRRPRSDHATIPVEYGGEG